MKRRYLMPHKTLGKGRSPGLSFLLGLTVLGGLVAIACSRGSYPVDIFPEMHYSQSVRIQEPPSLSPPEGAVPIGGIEDPLSILVGIDNPLPLDGGQEDTRARGAFLYSVNCAMCHGISGDGNSFIANRLKAFKANPPPSLVDSALVRTSPDGVIFAVLTSGITVMPPFKDLLTENDRWALVRYIQSLAQ